MRVPPGMNVGVDVLGRVMVSPEGGVMREKRSVTGGWICEVLISSCLTLDGLRSQ
jgi:hypothetical protein